MTETIATIPDLLRVKHRSGLDAVTVHSGALKRRGLLRHGLKYALWALKPSGTLRIIDDGPVTFAFQPGSMPWQRVKQQAFAVLGDDVALETLDDATLTLTLRRTRPASVAGWSAGIVFSGDAKEMPAMAAAIAGLRAQRECMQIMVCGPAAAAAMLTDHGTVDYIAYDVQHRRTPIPHKKNALIAAARHAKVAILHARIVLQPGCLAAMPAEFDLITPRVEYREGAVTIPYLDWSVTDALDGAILPRRQPPRNDYDRARYLELMRLGLPYIDGGLFMVDRAAALLTPLNEHLAWGEAEDVEWCARLHAAGRLIDLQPDALALSQTFKWSRRMIEKPRFFAVARTVKRVQRRMQSVFAR